MKRITTLLMDVAITMIGGALVLLGGGMCATDISQMMAKKKPQVIDGQATVMSETPVRPAPAPTPEATADMQSHEA